MGEEPIPKMISARGEKTEGGDSRRAIARKEALKPLGKRLKKKREKNLAQTQGEGQLRKALGEGKREWNREESLFRKKNTLEEDGKVPPENQPPRSLNNLEWEEKGEGGFLEGGGGSPSF